MNGKSNTLKIVGQQSLIRDLNLEIKNESTLTCKDFVAGRIEANRISGNHFVQVVICSIGGPKIAAERVPHVQRVISAGANKDARRWLS